MHVGNAGSPEPPQTDGHGTTASPWAVLEQGHFREVKTGVLLLPGERVETSPGRRSVVRRFLVTCLGDADEIFRRLYAQLRELGWVDPHTVVVIVGDGAEWIWNRATMFVNRCEILDFWHALEHRLDFLPACVTETIPHRPTAGCIALPKTCGPARWKT